MPEPLLAGDQFPGKLDGFALEVVAERKVPQHLKECVVAARKPNVFQVLMLAAGAHAFLAGGRPTYSALLRAEEEIFELVYARVGEQQRRVIGRHQRRGVHPAVPLRLKKAQKQLAYLVPCAKFHGFFSVIALGPRASAPPRRVSASNR